jgi:predicted amidohydrolase YtcJ
MPPGPLFGIKGATHHAIESQRLAPAQAFYRYTRASRDVFGEWEDEPDGAAPSGRIEPGARADLVVLSAHPLLADTDALRVEATFADGEEVFRARSAACPTKYSKQNL